MFSQKAESYSIIILVIETTKNHKPVLTHKLVLIFYLLCYFQFINKLKDELAQKVPRVLWEDIEVTIERRPFVTGNV